MSHLEQHTLKENPSHQPVGLELPTTLPFEAPKEDYLVERLTQKPSMNQLYLKVFKPRPGLKRGESVPKLNVLCQLKMSAQWLKDYQSICGWNTPESSKEIEAVPLTAPQVFAAPLHMYILTHARFPVSALGVVHASNEIIATQALDVNVPLEVSVWTGETEWHDRGFELELFTSIKQANDEKPRWLAKMTMFKVIKAQQSKSQGTMSATKQDQLLSQVNEHALQLPANLGRRYAPIAGDYNPIHLYPFTARLFGFKKPIIHGMWTLAHLLSMRYAQPSQLCLGCLSVQFRRPLPLPLKSSWRIEEEQETCWLQALDPRGKLAVNIAIRPSKSTELT